MRITHLGPCKRPRAPTALPFGPGRTEGAELANLQTISRRGEPSTPAQCADAHDFSLYAPVRYAERLKRNHAGDVVLN
jgi:hypothetical protein